MKSKKFSKKLALRKETIANLDFYKMEGDIYGLFELKEAADVPFRLIRVKLSK